MKAIGIGVTVLFGLGLLSLGGIAMGVINWPFHTAGNLVNTAYDAQDKVINADNAIYNYEWFKQQKQDIDAAKDQLDNANVAYASFVASAGPRSSWTFEDKTEDSRLRTVSLGLENHLRTLIADYDARASEATRNIFQNGVLPSYIDALTFIKK